MATTESATTNFIISYCTIIIFIIIVYISRNEVKSYIIRCSGIDNRCYKIKKIYDPESYNNAADILAYLNESNLKLIKNMKKKYFNKNSSLNNKYKKILTRNLLVRYNPYSLEEHTPKGLKNLSYVYGKGKRVGFCLREKKTGGNNLHKISTIMFVNLHELTHIASTKNDPGHKIIFWKNFKIILKEAEEIGIYKPIDYKKTPANYCGMNVFYNPYFNKKL